MKKLLKSVIPSIIGSGLTIAVFLLIGFNRVDSTSASQKQEFSPVHKALYTVKENGEFVPLGFIGVSKEVMNSVVHIRSERKVQAPSNSFYNNQPNPFDDFFRFFQGAPKTQRQGGRQSEPMIQMGTASGGSAWQGNDLPG